MRKKKEKCEGSPALITTNDCVCDAAIFPDETSVSQFEDVKQYQQVSSDNKQLILPREPKYKDSTSPFYHQRTEKKTTKWGCQDIFAFASISTSAGIRNCTLNLAEPSLRLF